MKLNVLIHLLMALILCSGAAIAKDTDDLTSFARLGQYKNFKISPDGRRVAALYAEKDNNFELVIHEKGNKGFEALASVQRGTILYHQWIDDQRLIFLSGTEYGAVGTRFLMVDVKSKKARGLGEGMNMGMSLLERLPHDRDHVLVEFFPDQDRSAFPDIYRFLLKQEKTAIDSESRPKGEQGHC